MAGWWIPQITVSSSLTQRPRKDFIFINTSPMFRIVSECEFWISIRIISYPSRVFFQNVFDNAQPFSYRLCVFKEKELAMVWYVVRPYDCTRLKEYDETIVIDLSGLSTPCSESSSIFLEFHGLFQQWSMCTDTCDPMNQLQKAVSKFELKFKIVLGIIQHSSNSRFIIIKPTDLALIFNNVKVLQISCMEFFWEKDASTLLEQERSPQGKLLGIPHRWKALNIGDLIHAVSIAVYGRDHLEQVRQTALTLAAKPSPWDLSLLMYCIQRLQ